MDEFSVRSHQRALAGRQAGHLDEVVPVVDGSGKVYAEDDGVRADASMAGMAKLKPFFDKKYGNVTAANSSQITDGAAWVLLASEEAVQKWGLKPIGKIVDSHWAGLEPEQMGLGPVHATTPLLQRNGLTLADVDYWELNEAFAAQVLACQAAWQDDTYCREQLGLSGAFGHVPDDKLNVDGGAVSIGHPVGASGARIVLHLLQVLRRQNAQRGVATICIGGGLGGAMLLETVNPDAL
jgi:acetyl-CoA C-acetyltransferase